VREPIFREEIQMCLVVVAVDEHSRYPLIVIANRDEFYARPTVPLHAWDEQPSLLAGKDVLHGGTWAGWHREGRFAALTNIRRPQAMASGKRSRGELPLEYLQQRCDLDDFVQKLRNCRGDYAPFNLLVGGVEGLSYLSSDTLEPVALRRGVYALSNASLDSPWPKVIHAREKLTRALASSGPLEPESLFACVGRAQSFPDDELPDTGVGLAWERILSAPFIVSPDYGTRSTLLLLADREGGATLTERSFHATLGPAIYHQRTYRVPLPA